MLNRYLLQVLCQNLVKLGDYTNLVIRPGMSKGDFFFLSSCLAFLGPGDGPVLARGCPGDCLRMVKG